MTKILTCLALVICLPGMMLAHGADSCDDPYAVDVVQRILSSPTTMASSGESADAAQQRLMPLTAQVVPLLNNYIPR